MKNREKIWADEYIDLTNLLESESPVYNLALSAGEDGQQHLTWTSRSRRKLLSISDWGQAFDIFMSVYGMRFPHRLLDMLQYARVVRELSAAQGNWIQYDETFRRTRAKTQHPWSQIMLQDWVRASLAPTTTVKKHESSSEPKSKSSNTKPSPPKRNPPPFKPGLCFSFNYGKTCSPDCRFEHICNHCGKSDHPDINCPEKQGNTGVNFRPNASLPSDPK